MAVVKINESKQLREGNPVTDLPPSIDSFLQDLSQEFGDFTYADISDFNPTKEEIRKLRYLKNKMTKFVDDSEDDSKFAKYAKRVADIVLNSGIEESLEEGFSDGRVSQSDIVSAIDALQGLLDEMETLDVDEIIASGTTSGLGRFYAAFPGGFIDLDNAYQYLPDEQDEEEEEYDEGLKVEAVSSTSLEDEITEKVADEVLPQLSDPDMWDVIAIVDIGDEGQNIGEVTVAYSRDEAPEESELDEIRSALEAALFDYAGESIRINDTSDNEVTAYFDIVRD